MVRRKAAGALQHLVRTHNFTGQNVSLKNPSVDFLSRGDPASILFYTEGFLINAFTQILQIHEKELSYMSPLSSKHRALATVQFTQKVRTLEDLYSLSEEN